jgi:hypothetical protein
MILCGLGGLTFRSASVRLTTPVVGLLGLMKLPDIGFPYVQGRVD